MEPLSLSMPTILCVLEIATPFRLPRESLEMTKKVYETIS